MPQESQMVLDYTQSYFKAGNVFDKLSFCNPTARDIYDRFRNSRSCSYCNRKVKPVLSIEHEYNPGLESATAIEWLSIRVYGCGHCGWWCETKTFVDSATWTEQCRTVSILREFAPSDVSLPLQTLRMELLKRPEVLYDIHSRKFEHLVADVVGNFYKTDVRVVGKTGDRGIDLVYLDGDTPVAIQVKRRQRPDMVETVKLVREFLGALVLEGFKRAKIITTAEKFTRGAIQASREAIGKPHIDIEEFDLIDAKGFYEMFRFRERENIRFPWQIVVNRWIDQWKDTPEAAIRAWKL